MALHFCRKVVCRCVEDSQVRRHWTDIMQTERVAFNCSDSSGHRYNTERKGMNKFIMCFFTSGVVGGPCFSGLDF